MATNMFIKFDGVDGESTDDKHKKWIEILSWSHGFSQPSSPVQASSGSTVEKANHSDISITKYMDDATNELLKACWLGKQYKTVDIECQRAAGNAAIKYLAINMEGVIISNYSMSGGGGDIPIENLSLAYRTVKYSYIGKKKPEDGQAEGAKEAKADLTKNTVE